MQIPELKSRLPILEVAQRLGIVVNASGKALCPFHEDKGPSLQFSQEKGIATCFSSRCSAGTMDIVRLTEKKLKLTTHQALLQLTEWAEPPPASPAAIPVPPAAAPLPDKAPLMEKVDLLTQAFSYFENGLRTAKAAKAYLQGRGLRQSSPTQEGIEVGFHSGNLHNRQPELLPSMLHYGLLQPHTGNAGGYNAFARNCLVFPLKNGKGQISGLYFREIEEGKPSRHYSNIG